MDNQAKSIQRRIKCLQSILDLDRQFCSRINEINAEQVRSYIAKRSAIFAVYDRLLNPGRPGTLSYDFSNINLSSAEVTLIDAIIQSGALCTATAEKAKSHLIKQISTLAKGKSARSAYETPSKALELEGKRSFINKEA
jgi:hypothetical protein